MFKKILFILILLQAFFIFQVSASDIEIGDIDSLGSPRYILSKDGNYLLYFYDYEKFFYNGKLYNLQDEIGSELQEKIGKCYINVDNIDYNLNYLNINCNGYYKIVLNKNFYPTLKSTQISNTKSGFPIINNILDQYSLKTIYDGKVINYKNAILDELVYKNKYYYLDVEGLKDSNGNIIKTFNYDGFRYEYFIGNENDNLFINSTNKKEIYINLDGNYNCKDTEGCIEDPNIKKSEKVIENIDKFEDKNLYSFSKENKKYLSFNGITYGPYNDLSLFKKGIYEKLNNDIYYIADGNLFLNGELISEKFSNSTLNANLGNKVIVINYLSKTDNKDYFIIFGKTFKGKFSGKSIEVDLNCGLDENCNFYSKSSNNKNGYFLNKDEDFNKYYIDKNGNKYGPYDYVYNPISGNVFGYKKGSKFYLNLINGKIKNQKIDIEKNQQIENQKIKIDEIIEKIKNQKIDIEKINKLILKIDTEINKNNKDSSKLEILKYLKQQLEIIIIIEEVKNGVIENLKN